MKNNIRELIDEYLKIALRRKWYIIIPFIVCIFASYGVYKYLPKVYKASTMILVQPQKIPESYVRSTNTVPITERLNTITQEVLSRTSLEKVIKEFDLFPEMKAKVTMEEIVERLRKLIDVRVQSRGAAQSAFSVSVEGEDPQKVMLVTNKLASLFIEENLRVREIQAESTSDFLSRELARVEEELSKKEQTLRTYRERNMGQLPQQLDGNLRILESLQQQFKRISDNIRSAEDRNIILQSQIEQLKRQQENIPQSIPAETPRERATVVTEEGRIEQAQDDPVIIQWNQLKKELTQARSKYTEKHPDVMDLERRLANLEPRVKEAIKKQEEFAESQRKEMRRRREAARVPSAPIAPNAPIPRQDPINERLLIQYNDQINANLMEINRSKEEEKKLREQINIYQRRIEETPRREQELLVLTRDYDLLRGNYQSLLEKKLQSKLAENLERKQQGEQFKVLDPARFPEKPIRPDRDKMLLMGAAIGLMAGLGLAWFRETWNQKFHTEAEVEQTLGIPVIAVIPNLKEDKAA